MFDKRGSRKYLNGSERRAFLKVAIQEPDLARRTFCLTLFYTGCRISEALNLTNERVDVSARVIILETLKQRRTGHFRAVPIPETLCESLWELAKRKTLSVRIWGFSRATGYRMIKNYMALAGITGGMASPKGLRHGMAIACLAQKIPLPTVQKWLGHARLETTAIYIDVSGEEERELAVRLWAAD